VAVFIIFIVDVGSEMGALTVYLDTCAYGRVRDDQTQPDIKAETAAIKAITNRAGAGALRIIGSFAVISELDEIDDHYKRDAIKVFYMKNKSGEVIFTQESAVRAKEIEAKGLGKMDAVHLAAAETGSAKYLITTDKKFIGKCNREKITIVKVINPIDFNKGGFA
jgi:predicted nucleic acid-binding protein